MAVLSQAQSDSNALSPPLTPNPDPQSRDEAPTTHSNENGNGRKRSQTAAAPSPKRRRVEDDAQNAIYLQQQTSDLRRQSGNGVGLGLGQREQGHDTLRSALLEAQAQAQPRTIQTNTAEAMYQASLRMQQSHSPVLVQSPNFSTAPMPPPPSSSTAALRRTSGSPAIQQEAWGASSVSQSPNMGHRQAQSGKYFQFPVRYPLNFFTLLIDPTKFSAFLLILIPY